MIAGIDLGTTHSLAGLLCGGLPVLVPGFSGRRLTPSVVWFPPDAEPVVGWEALEAIGHDPARVIASSKRWIGCRVSGDGVSSGTMEPAPDGMFRLPERTVSAEEVAACILRKLRGDLNRFAGADVNRAVITVPAYFNDAQRSATKRAGEAAGFVVERILSEPTAAALAYGLDRLGTSARVAVYDLGGGTFDVSILELHQGVFEVLATNGNTRLGGDDLDKALAASWGITPLEAEKLKRLLGEADRVDFQGRVFTREELDAICRPLIESTRLHCQRSLADAGLKASDLDAVVLVGGATRMPLVRSFVQGIFQREPDLSQHPDEAVALGATIQAGILEGALSELTLLDVTPLSLGLETFGGLMNVLIPRNSTIPCKKGEMFTNAVSSQAEMRISILQGEREMARDNWKLGELVIPFPPAPKGQARVGVQFEIDANGILQVLARDTATGTDRRLAISSAVDVTDEAVEKMLGDSLEHAFSDVEERVFTETRIKALEMLPALEIVMAGLGADLEEFTRVKVHDLVSAIHRAIEARATRELKSLIHDLDILTEPLAAEFLEKSLDLRDPSEPLPSK